MACSRAVRYRSTTALFLGIAALFPVVLFAADAVTPAAPVPPPADPATHVNGYLSTRYTFRTVELPGGRQSDQDVFADLRLDITRPKQNDYEFHFLGSFRTDLDGDQGMSTFAPFETVWDTFGDRSAGKIYEAYFTLNSGATGPDTKARVGRQAGSRDEPVFFDGIAVDAGGEQWDLTVYGGAAVHFFEVRSHWGEDRVSGAGMDYRPFASTGVSADYLLVKDAMALFPDDAVQYDRLTAFKITQRIEPFTRLTAKYRFRDGEPRDLSFKAVTASETAGFEAGLNYFRQFRSQNELSNDLSLFYDVIGRSAPYESYDIKLRKFIVDRVALDLGYYQRELLDIADEGPFNKEFERMFIDVEVMDLVLNNLSCTVLAEQWESKGRTYDALGADLSYRFKRNTRDAKVSIGTNYSLYKYDYYTELGVREQVRTYYVNAKYPLSRGFAMNGAYEYEHGIEDYQTLRLGMRYDF